MRLAAAVMVAGLFAAQAPELGALVRADVARQEQAIVGELLQLLAIPNVAADRPNIRRNAEHLQRLLTRHGLRAEILETDGNPLVFGAADFGKPHTVLFYCHYDGQPVEAKKWTQADPLEPVLRGESADARIY